MKAVVTRVNSASVSIDGSVCGRIGKGFLILLGVAPEDTPEKCRKLAEKILGLRVFRDENDKMNLSLSDVGGEVLVVSQFTLYGDVSHGRRPSFIGAGKPDIAIPLYEQFLSECERLGFPPQHGEFGAYMQVASENDGPVTLIVDTNDSNKRSGSFPSEVRCTGLTYTQYAFARAPSSDEKSLAAAHFPFFNF